MMRQLAWRNLPLATKLAFFFIAASLLVLVAFAFVDDARAGGSRRPGA